MLASTLLLTAAGATVAVHVTDVVGVQPAVARTIGFELAWAVERYTEHAVIFDAAAPARACVDEPCFFELKKKTGADELVFAGMFGGLTKVRLIVERVSFPNGKIARSKQELERRATAGDWINVFEDTVRDLYPGQKPVAVAAPPLSASPIPAVEERDTLVPWLFAGGAIAALVTAAGFGASSLDARGSIANEPHTSAELLELDDRMRGHATVAGVLVGAAGALALAGAWIALE